MQKGNRVRRIASLIVRGLLLWAGVALVFFVATLVLPGFDQPSFAAAVLATGLMAVLNAVLWPLAITRALPLTVITFGLGSLVLNAAIVSLALKLVDGDSARLRARARRGLPAFADPDAARARSQPGRRRPPAAHRSPPRAARCARKTTPMSPA